MNIYLCKVPRVLSLAVERKVRIIVSCLLMFYFILSLCAISGRDFSQPASQPARPYEQKLKNATMTRESVRGRSTDGGTQILRTSPLPALCVRNLHFSPRLITRGINQNAQLRIVPAKDYRQERYDGPLYQVYKLAIKALLLYFSFSPSHTRGESFKTRRTPLKRLDRKKVPLVHVVNYSSLAPPGRVM